MSDTYVSSMYGVEIRPAVPAHLNAGLGNDCLLVKLYDGDDHSTVEPTDEAGYAMDEYLTGNLQRIVDTLGEGYTYSGYLQCYSTGREGREWRVMVNDEGKAVRVDPLDVVYPGEALILPDAGPITSALSAADIETALATLAEMWSNPDLDVLSSRQAHVAEQVYELWRQQVGDGDGS